MSLIRNPFFYVTFGVVCIVAIGVVLGGSWQGVWNSYQSEKVAKGYISTSQIGSDPIDLMSISMDIGEKNISSGMLIDRAAVVMKKLGEHLEVDVIDMLSQTNDKKGVLQSYVNTLKAYVDEATSIQRELVSQSRKFDADSRKCLSKKEDADKKFFVGFDSLESDKISEGYTASKEYGECYISNRVEANAYGVLADKLQFFIDNGKEKQQLIVRNQDVIVENFQLFKDDNMDKLIQLKEVVDQFKIDQKREF